MSGQREAARIPSDAELFARAYAEVRVLESRIDEALALCDLDGTRDSTARRLAEAVRAALLGES